MVVVREVRAISTMFTRLSPAHIDVNFTVLASVVGRTCALVIIHQIGAISSM